MNEKLLQILFLVFNLSPFHFVLSHVFLRFCFFVDVLWLDDDIFKKEIGEINKNTQNDFVFIVPCFW